MAGRTISRANMARIQQIADHAHAMGAKGPGPDTTPIKADSLGDQIEAVARAVMQTPMAYVEDVFDGSVVLCICDPATGTEAYYRADYTTDAQGVVTLAPREAWAQVEEVWQPVTSATKAGAPMDADGGAVIATVKALGDRTLELCVAWGFDGHGEQFTPHTDFDLENFPTPPVLYYHGYKADGKKAPKPIVIGRTVKRENRAGGHYLTTEFNTKAEAERVLKAAPEGRAVVSPGTAGHLIRKEPDGTLTYWPIVEISAWDWDGSPARKQAHPRSLAFPALKAAYLEAGIPVPPSLESGPAEVAGDAAPAEIPASQAAARDADPLTPDQQRELAAQIVAAQLRIYRQETRR